MNIYKGRKHLSKHQLEEVEDLERRCILSKTETDKVKAKKMFTTGDKTKLGAYFKMIDYLGKVNG